MDGFTYAGKLIPKGKYIDYLSIFVLDILSALMSFIIELYNSIVFRYFSKFSSIIYRFIKCGSSSMP